VSGLEESFAGRIEFITLDFDDKSLDGLRDQLGFTAQAQYLVVNAAGEIAQRWFGRLDETKIAAELEALLQT